MVCFYFQTETVLFQDALTLFTDAVNDLSIESGIQSTPLSCSGEGKAPDGDRIHFRMKSVSEIFSKWKDNSISLNKYQFFL